MAGNSRNLNDIRFRVHRWETLGWSRDDYAKQLLERGLKFANTILESHRWAVMLVSEFYPRDKRLLGLNVNHGEHIKIRLRRPNNKNEFFAFEEIMCTILHEIVHNTIGPHNKQFYALYYSLVRECELLQVQAMNENENGEYRSSRPAGGPGAPGQTLGGGGGRRLGGGPPTGVRRGEGYDSIRTRVLAAAERRLTEAAEAVARAECCASQDDRLRAATLVHGQESVPRTALQTTRPPLPAPGWICSLCGFENNALLPYCEVCTADDVGDDGDVQILDSPPPQRDQTRQLGSGSGGGDKKKERQTVGFSADAPILIDD